jgi:Major tropism determinant N-terminal domain
MALKIRRGTQTQRLNIVPAQGELVFDVTQNKLYIGNGSTAGGIEVVGGVIGGSLGSNVNLGGFDITGTGNINITGTITASGTITANGDIVLGNADTDNVQFGADINSNIVPNTNSLTLGTSAKPWQTTFAQNISNNSSDITVLSRLSLTNNIVPNINGTLSVGTGDRRLAATYTNEVYTEGLRLFQNDISTTESNANITLTPQGTGVVATPKVRLVDSIDVGPTDTNLIKIDGSQGNGMIKYNFNSNTNLFNIIEQSFSGSYTQLVTNAAETITFFQTAFDPLASFNGEAFELTIRFKNSTGSQIVKVLGTIFGSTPAIKKIDEIASGVAPVASFTSTFAANTYQLQAVTNTATAAAEVTSYQMKFTTFMTV